MNGTLTGGVVDTPINSGSGASEAPENTGAGQPGVGEGAPQNPETGAGNAGAPQGAAEGGMSEGASGTSRRQRQLLIDRDEILGLREYRRSADAKMAALMAKLEEIQAGGMTPQPKPGTTKTEQDFFADPDSRFMSLSEKLDSLEDRIAEKVTKNFETIRQKDSRNAELNQEKSEAVKLVHSQPGWDKADDHVLIDIIEENGLGVLPPLVGVKAALAIFREEKGIGDRSQVKARAASLVGAPGASGGAKIWPKAEVERLLDIEMRKNPDQMNQALIDEIKLAQAENRIR